MSATARCARPGSAGRCSRSGRARGARRRRPRRGGGSPGRETSSRGYWRSTPPTSSRGRSLPKSNPACLKTRAGPRCRTTPRATTCSQTSWTRWCSDSETSGGGSVGSRWRHCGRPCWSWTRPSRRPRSGRTCCRGCGSWRRFGSSARRIAFGCSTTSCPTCAGRLLSSVRGRRRNGGGARRRRGVSCGPSFAASSAAMRPHSTTPRRMSSFASWWARTTRCWRRRRNTATWACGCGARQRRSWPRTCGERCKGCETCLRTLSSR
mmetsp:Transcript_20951/g.67448  ORF Transcript_20951/g.67448 Transcript_20951/m.67448 type:complete len:265 (+) Transcript_20951:116-910(+)